ncbi:MAG: WXG100 family type VII secretion target [Acidimicrobiaceae bacterium]|nr:WXG100 family type VII secretion target [Acidimicrobiaceae bacterium]
MAQAPNVIKVSFTAMEQASSDIKRSAAVIDHQLGDLGTYLESLEATWQGAASDGYRQQKQRWQRAAVDLNGILTTLARALDDASGNYRGAEQDLVRIWG